MKEKQAGWSGGFEEFKDADPHAIAEKLAAFVPGAGTSQVRAWEDSIPPMQREATQLLSEPWASGASAIMEYQLPMEFRRADVVVLAAGDVFILELKGKDAPSKADLDQVSGYARDLRAYHESCHERPVWPVLVPMRWQGKPETHLDVTVCSPESVDEVVRAKAGSYSNTSTSLADFLNPESYSPLPSIIEAARELMEKGELRYIKRAHSATEQTLLTIKSLCEEAARSGTRKLALLRGAPGSGKTLVGLQLAHSRWLEDLAVERSGKRKIPAVFLSGNGPLVEVLQYQLRSAGGEGKTFVRGVKEYVARYSKSPSLVPDEHVLIYDEAQRAWDADRVAAGHADGRADGKSEPELFVEFANRVPGWCVVVGLIGTGQEIHVGEEGGTDQWLSAISNIENSSEWEVIGPKEILDCAHKEKVKTRISPEMSLDVTIRFHAAQHLATWVEQLLVDLPEVKLEDLAKHLRDDGYRLYITRDLEQAKRYLRDRYADEPSRRFGILASSRDRISELYGVKNGWQDTKTLRTGPWFADGPGSHLSCTNLDSVATEFACQGLELDQALLAWGSDFVRREGKWSNAEARNYRKGTSVRDPMVLRRNAYRVLLTRGRDGSVIFVPPHTSLDETFEYLKDSGCEEL